MCQKPAGSIHPFRQNSVLYQTDTGPQPGMTNYPIGPHVNGCAAQKTSHVYVTSLTTKIYSNEMLGYDTRCYFNVQSKADKVSLIYLTETTTKKWKKRNRNGCAQKYLYTVQRMRGVSPGEKQEGYMVERISRKGRF